MTDTLGDALPREMARVRDVVLPQYVAIGETTDAVATWKMAKDAYDKALEAKTKDYYALIHGARTYEQVLEVWPEAEVVRAEMTTQAIIVLSDDVVARIRADVAQRAA